MLCTSGQDLWELYAYISVVYGPTCDGVLAAVALLGHVSFVAVHAVNVILVGGEASSCQRFTAGLAHKALRVPRLVLVADPSRGDGLNKEAKRTSRQMKQD